MSKEMIDANSTSPTTTATTSPTNTLSNNIDEQIAQDYANPKLDVVQIDGLVVLKIIKQCKEYLPDLVPGQLLGLDIGTSLEVSNCFPFPNPQQDDDNNNESIAEYQLEMMRYLREVNIDSNTVGWYTPTYLNSFFNESVIETQYNYQATINQKCVVIVYDPIKTSQGTLSLKCYRLTHNFMELFKDQTFSRERLEQANLSFNDIFEQIPIKIHNSQLINALLYELEGSNQMPTNFDRLNISNNIYLEKVVEGITDCMGNLNQELNKLFVYQKNIQNQKNYIQKRALEGQKVDEDELASMFKPVNQPSKLSSLLLTNQINNYCDQIHSFSGNSLTKLSLLKELQKLYENDDCTGEVLKYIYIADLESPCFYLTNTKYECRKERHNTNTDDSGMGIGSASKKKKEQHSYTCDLKPCDPRAPVSNDTFHGTLKSGHCSNGRLLTYSALDFLEEDYCLLSITEGYYSGDGNEMCEYAPRIAEVLKKGQCIEGTLVDCGFSFYRRDQPCVNGVRKDKYLGVCYILDPVSMNISISCNDYAFLQRKKKPRWVTETKNDGLSIIHSTIILQICSAQQQQQQPTSASTTSTDQTKSSLNKLEVKLQVPSETNYSKMRARLIDNSDYSETIEVPNKNGRVGFYYLKSNNLNSFNISSGSYTLDIESYQYQFQQYRIDVSGGVGGKNKQIKIRTYDNDTVLAQPLIAKAQGKISFYQQHVPFSIFNFIQNPMIISIGFTCVLIVVLPKMQGIIESDEDTKNQLKASTPDLIQGVPEWPKFKAISSKQIEMSKDK
eukprot:gene3990-4991_t